MRLPGSTYFEVMPRSGINEPGNCASKSVICKWPLPLLVAASFELTVG